LLQLADAIRTGLLPSRLPRQHRDDALMVRGGLASQVNGHPGAAPAASHRSARQRQPQKKGICI